MTWVRVHSAPLRVLPKPRPASSSQARQSPFGACWLGRLHQSQSCSIASSSRSLVRFRNAASCSGGSDASNSAGEWAADHLVHPLNTYTAYPDLTAKEVKALVTAADVSGGGEQRPFLVILPTRSRLAFIEIQLLLRARSHGITRDLDSVGTPHFAQFVPLENNQIGFFTVYDGSFDKYIADFTKTIGQVFDLIFKFTKDPPPSPCRMHLQEFIEFAARANRTPIGFYQAYPGLSVQDIHALIADSKPQSISA